MKKFIDKLKTEITQTKESEIFFKIIDDFMFCKSKEYTFNGYSLKFNFDKIDLLIFLSSVRDEDKKTTSIELGLLEKDVWDESYNMMLYKLSTGVYYLIIRENINESFKWDNRYKYNLNGEPED